MLRGEATDEPPLDPTEVSLPSELKMFDQATIQAIKTDFGSGTIGIRFTRDGVGSKYISSSCEIQFGIEANNHADCQSYTLDYGDSPVWTVGNMTACSVNCNPLGTSGSVDHLHSMGLYDSRVCFDAWGYGVAANAAVWVR